MATKVSRTTTSDGLAQQARRLFANVAAKDGHGADAQAQGEERLVHGSHDAR